MTSAPVELPLEALDAQAFAPFGTVIPPREDGTPFSAEDAVLDLSQGTPRFYTMRIPGRGLEVRTITRHQNVTQVLAAAGGHGWAVAVAAPGELVDGDAPDIGRIRAFVVPGDVAVKLHAGTWHAGPLFEGDPAAFFNLELADTNEVDHDSCELLVDYDIALRLIPSPAAALVPALNPLEGDLT